MRILIVGETCCDVFKFGYIKRLDPAAPAPVFNPIYSKKNKGMAGNVEENLKSLGAETVLYTNENWESITKTRFTDEKTNYILLREDVDDDKYGRCDVNYINFSHYDAVIISDYNKSFLTEQDIQFIIKNHPLVVIDTKKKIGPWCEDASFIKINNDEFNKAVQITEKLKEKLIITVGPEGCIHKGKRYPVPVVEQRDLSGCGDSFLAGFVFKFVETRNVDKAIEFGNECGTYVAQHRGVTVVKF